VLVFQLSEKDLTDANGKGIYIAFIPTNGSNSYGSLISGVNLVLFEFITPAGDPVNAPVDAGTTPTSIPDGANEFTFSTATNGVLTMKLKAKVPGVGSMPAAEQAKFTFEIDTIGSSTFAWDGANPGGKATISGDFITATATYAGLPQNYTDFGLKKARVKHGGNNAGEAKFEVFFPRDAKNHPGIRNVTDPNWFFYWEQLIPGHNLRYRGESSDDSNAEVPAMKSWNYHLTADKTSISIFSSLCGEGRQYDVGKFFSGVDAFLAMVLHELKHVDQIARADILVPTGQAGSPWSNGWSFERPNHNHWTVGADGKPGVAGVDDDGDGKIDNLVQGGPGELGRGDDVDLSHPKAYAQDWPSAWPIPSPLKHKLETEAEAINYADQQHDEHEKARSDWGNPGKNHNTIDKWND